MATQIEIGKHLDMSDRNVRDLIKRGVLPGSRGPGGLDLDECRVAYIRYMRGIASGQVSSSEDLDAAHERARKDKAQADKTELEVARLKRQMVIWAAVEKGWGGMLARLRSKLLTLPSKIAPLVQASDGEYATITEITRKAVSDALRELSDDPGEEIVEAPDVYAVAEPTAGPDSKRVGRRASETKPGG